MLNTHGYVSLGPYLCKTVVVPAKNDFRRKKLPEIVATMNHCRSAPLRVIAAIHNPHTTQKMTYRKQVVRRVVDHNYGSPYAQGNWFFDRANDFRPRVAHWAICRIFRSYRDYHYQHDQRGAEFFFYTYMYMKLKFNLNHNQMMRSFKRINNFTLMTFCYRKRNDPQVLVRATIRARLALEKILLISIPGIHELLWSTALFPVKFRWNSWSGP